MIRLAKSSFFYWLYITKKLHEKFKVLKSSPFGDFNSQNLTKFKKKTSNFYTWFYYVTKKLKCVLRNLFSYLVCNQIWLNIHEKNCQFGSITKFFKKNIGGAWDDTLSQFLFPTLTFAKKKREEKSTLVPLSKIICSLIPKSLGIFLSF